MDESRSGQTDGPPAGTGFQALLGRFEGELRRVVAGMGFHPADADDILQDVHLEALRRPGRYRGDDQARGWLLKVTVNRCTLEYRRRERFRRKAADILSRQETPGGAPAGPAVAAARAEELERVRECLHDLDEKLLAPLVLRYFNDLTSERIGAALGLPAGTVRSRLHEARMTLARRLMERGDGR